MQINLSPTSQTPSFGLKTQYLYHITPKKNYESMLRTGYIKTTHDRFIKEGVFMVDLKNFLENWGKSFVGRFKSDPIDDNLFNHVTKNNPNQDVVLLRIPVKKLNKKKLAVRSQDILFASNTMDGKNFKDGVEITDELLGHLQGKTLIKDAKKYKNDAVEYIFLDRIPIKDAKVIGEVNPTEYLDREKVFKYSPAVDYIVEMTQGVKKEKSVVDKELSKLA